MKPRRPTTKQAQGSVAVWYETTLKPWMGLVSVAIIAIVGIFVLQSRAQDSLGVVGGCAFLAGIGYYGLRGRGDSPLAWVSMSPRRGVVAITFVLLWGGATFYPFLRILYPGNEAANFRLTPEQPDRTFRYSGRLPLMFLVHSRFRGQGGAAEGTYGFRYARNGKSVLVEGEFERTYQTGRGGRRGRMTSGSTVTFETRRQFGRNLGSGEYRVHLEDIGESLHPSLQVRIFRAPYPTWVPFVAAPLLLVCGMMLDAALSRRGHRSYITAAVAVTVGFVYWCQTQLTPDNVTSTIVGGALVSFIAGGLSGGLLGVIAQRSRLGRLFG